MVVEHKNRNNNNNNKFKKGDTFKVNQLKLKKCRVSKPYNRTNNILNTYVPPPLPIHHPNLEDDGPVVKYSHNRTYFICACQEHSKHPRYLRTWQQYQFHKKSDEHENYMKTMEFDMKLDEIFDTLRRNLLALILGPDNLPDEY